MSAEDKLYLTTEQLAQRWLMDAGTLAHWRCRGDGPKYLKLGNNVRYVLSDVEIFEQAQTRGGAAA